MQRRDFLAGTVAAAGATVFSTQARRGGVPDRAADPQFKLRYAPPLEMFREHVADPVDRVKWIADQGFRAIEDNGMAGRPVAVQEAVRRELDRYGMQMGVFVASADFGRVDFASSDPAATEAILAGMRRAIEVAERVGAQWCTVVPGRYDQGVEWDYQTANVVANLKRACEVCEPAGLTMVLEPLNAWRDHPGLFLTRIPQAYMICRAVGSPSCRILFDVYHQQINEGNLIPNIDRAWDEIAYFQIGDNPGRKEPGTGEINYRNIFRHLFRKGYDGLLGMEHGKSEGGLEGERRVIAAYRACDAFDA